MKRTNPLTVLKIQELANGVRVSYGISLDTFFPIKDYILTLHNKGKLNYQILEDDDPMFGGDPLTFALYNELDNTIYVKDSVDAGTEENDYRSNFTLAHELFHYLQAKVLNFKFEEVEKTEDFMNPEWQANEFAGQLLIPEDYVNLKIDELSDKFHVTKECASYRKYLIKKRMLAKEFKAHMPKIEEYLKNYKYYDAIDEAKILIALEDNQTIEKKEFDSKVEMYLFNELNGNE